MRYVFAHPGNLRPPFPVGAVAICLLSSLLLTLPLPTGAIRADELTVQATAGTDRYRPQPEESERDSVDSLLSGSRNDRRSTSQTDIRRGMGILYVTAPDEQSEDQRSFFLRASLGLYSTHGSYFSSRSSKAGTPSENNPTERGVEPPGAVLLAGENLHLGFRFCPRQICSLLLGRVSARDRLETKLTGDRGAIGGLHFVVAADWGRLLFTPYHVPSLTGEASLEELKYQAAFLLHGPVERRENLLRLSRKRNDYGHRLQYNGSIGLFHFAFFYMLAFYPDPSLADPLRLETAGLGLGFPVSYSSFRFHLYLTLERTLGDYRTPAADGTTESHPIDGYALRLGDWLQFGRLTLSLELFIPEPALFAAGNESDRPIRSGHLLSGKNPLQTPLLARSLDFRPSPTPCLHDQCRGVEMHEGEPGFRNHAATLALFGGYRGPLYLFFVGGQLLQPLQIRYGGAPSRFTGVKKQDRQLYYEISLRLSRHIAREGDISLIYSRLHQRTGESRRLVGEGLFLTLNYRLF